MSPFTAIKEWESEQERGVTDLALDDWLLSRRAVDVALDVALMPPWEGIASASHLRSRAPVAWTCYKMVPR